MSFIVQFVDVYGYKPSSSTRLYGLVNLGPSDKLQSYNCAFESFLKTQWSLDVTPGLTFTNSTFCPHSVFVCFVCICEQTAIISLYNIDWLVRVTETECLLRGTYWPLYIIQVVCFVWIWEQTAIISLYSIDWLVCITETECVYCAVRTGSLYVIQVVFCVDLRTNSDYFPVQH